MQEVDEERSEEGLVAGSLDFALYLPESSVQAEDEERSEEGLVAGSLDFSDGEKSRYVHC